jgi:hypothetical protein
MPPAVRFSPELGTHIRTGRNPHVGPIPASVRRLSAYLSTTLPSPPPVFDYSAKAAAALSQMYLNDQLGCCVESGIAHLEGVFTANAGRPLALYSGSGIVGLYSAWGGYVPGNPATDQGTNEFVALMDWQAVGAPKAPHQISGFVQVNAQNAREYRTAMYLFENLVFGFSLDRGWWELAAPGFVWDTPAVPDVSLGHCVVGVGANRNGIVVSTWGMTGTFTDRAIVDTLIAGYNGQLWCVLTQEIVNRATLKSPAGLNWPQLQADFGLLASS